MLKYWKCLTLGLIWTVTVAQSVAAANPEQCIGDWAQAATIVKKQKIIDVAGLSKLARHKFKGRIITARLCKSDETYFYRLIIRRSDGRMQHIKVDAAEIEK